MLQAPSHAEFMDIVHEMNYLDEVKHESDAGLLIEMDKRTTTWDLMKVRNNTGEMFDRYLNKDKSRPRRLVKTGSDTMGSADILFFDKFVLNVENDECHPAEAIVDVGESVPVVSRCALDKFVAHAKERFPDASRLICRDSLRLDLRMANGQRETAKEKVMIPMKLNLTDEWVPTAFSVTDLGKDIHIPFLFAMTQMNSIKHDC